MREYSAYYQYSYQQPLTHCRELIALYRLDRLTQFLILFRPDERGLVRMMSLEENYVLQNELLYRLNQEHLALLGYGTLSPSQ
ncbi:hypothetical protein D3C81_1114680 [compost metagenome]